MLLLVLPACGSKAACCGETRGTSVEGWFCYALEKFVIAVLPTPVRSLFADISSSLTSLLQLTGCEKVSSGSFGAISFFLDGKLEFFLTGDACESIVVISGGSIFVFCYFAAVGLYISSLIFACAIFVASATCYVYFSSSGGGSL